MKTKTIKIKTPIGIIERPNPYSELSDEDLLEAIVKDKAERGFIDPVLYANIEERGLCSDFSKRLKAK